jgi:hypothetical protein
MNIENPGAKGICVDEYDVTGSVIAVYDPYDQFLDSVEWDAVDGPVLRMVQVNQAGMHRIKVIYFGENNREVVQAVASTEFNIAPIVIAVIDINPGVVGLIHINGGQPSEPIDLTGY